MIGTLMSLLLASSLSAQILSDSAGSHSESIDLRSEVVEQQDAPLKLVLDTSVFTNPQTSVQFGNTTGTALATFIQLADAVRSKVQCYMPPSIYEELQTFLGEIGPPPRFELVVSLQPPNRYQIQVPGFLLYELIEDIRARIDRGLRLAERAVRETIQENVEHTITKLRDRYREALRAGLLDSREDVDLILLAIELPAALVSSDQGVVRWAERMGVRIIHPEQLRGALEELAAEQSSPPNQSMT
jgi:uncharacterized protein